MADANDLDKNLPSSAVGVDESWYRLMVETVATDYAIFLLDPNGFCAQFLEFRRTFNERLYMAEEIIGQHFFARFFIRRI